MKPETVLFFSCRLCGNLEHYVTSDHDAISVEAAFMDAQPVLSFQAIDAEGKIRTIHIKGADIRKIQRAPLTPLERAQMDRQIRGEKPLPKLPVMKGKK